ncbi:MAG: efflux RND transporter periplasmic adaptor subunit [Rhodospirillaceae bacterium]|nr:efflux RND transporter periplasmic adaptor subunit [Rhodospirillaceae bacterium]
MTTSQIKFVIAGVAVLAVAFGGWRLLAHKPDGAPQAQGSGQSGGPGGGQVRGPGGRGPGGGARTVIAEKVYREAIGDRIEAIGTIYANESVTVTAKTQGIMRVIAFDDGQTVKKGEEMAAIDSGIEDSALNVELANLEQQKKELTRIQSLATSNNIALSKLDDQTAAVKKAEANVASARARATDRRIIAPFSGIVGTRRISVGALVTPGTAVATLDDISVVKLDFAIPETFLASLHPGLEVDASASAYRGAVFKGKVVSVDARVDPVTRSVNVRALVQNDDLRLRPGMLMIVDLVSSPREALMVSEASVVPENGMQYLYVVGPDSVASRVAVTIGTRRNGAVEIVKGVKEGDLVLKEGMQDMRNGTKVNIINANELKGEADPASEAARQSMARPSPS